MSNDELWQELLKEVRILPVLCEEGIEHSSNWIEIESENGEEKVITCTKCVSSTVEDLLTTKANALNKWLQHLDNRNQLEAILNNRGEKDE